MKTYVAVGLAVYLGAFATPGAAAHQLVADDGSHTTADTAIFLEDSGLSQVVYHEVTAQSNALWIGFDAQPGDTLYWQLGLPALAGLEEYRPTVVLLGPGLPSVNVPFEVPDGLGGIVTATTGLPTQFFDERFTGTQDWILHEEDRPLAESGRYYLVAYHPDGTPGKFWLAVGRREQFGLADILAYEGVLGFVRDYHEVAEQPLPLLPRLLLTLSNILQFLCAPFSGCGQS